VADLPGGGFTLSDVIRDRGSRYAVSGGRVAEKAEAQAFLAALKREKKFARATHNSWAADTTAGGPLRNDDGESGAAAIILRMLEREGLKDHIIIVTRWYGGVHLGGDRFSHVTACVRAWLEAKAAQG